MRFQFSRVLLTHIVVAVGLSGFGAHEGNIGPFAIAVGVTLDQVVRRFPIPDPVAQELANSSSVDHSIAEKRPSLEFYVATCRNHLQASHRASLCYPKPMAVQ